MRQRMTPSDKTEERRDRLRFRLRLVGVVLLLLAIAAAAVSVGLASAPQRCRACHMPNAAATATHAEKMVSYSCWSCHSGPGELERYGRPVRLLRMQVARLFGRAPWIATVDERRCLACHKRIAAQVVTSRGITVRHKDFIAEQACQACHGEHRAATGPSLDRCAACHDGESAANTCVTCHKGGPPKLAAATGWMAVVHDPTRWHGPGSSKACVMCHKDDCLRCHEAQELPHESGPRWRLVHGSRAKGDLDGCRTCHDARDCVRCHRMEMPHPKGFLASHPEHAKRVGRPLCLTCHEDKNCVACHTGHVHRYVAGKRDR